MIQQRNKEKEKKSKARWIKREERVKIGATNYLDFVPRFHVMTFFTLSPYILVYNMTEAGSRRIGKEKIQRDRLIEWVAQNVYL